MWPFSSSKIRQEDLREQTQADMTKWQPNGSGENALPQTIGICISNVMAIQDMVSSQDPIPQEQAEALTRELWECAGNHKHSKTRVFQVLPEEAFLYARFRPVDIRAAKCISNEDVAAAFLNLDQDTVGSLKRYLVDCIGSENIGFWTDRRLDEGGLRDLHTEVQTLAAEVKSCEAILGPFLSAIQVAKKDIAPMFQECLDQAGTSCNQDQFAMIRSKTDLDLKLTYKLKDTCEARGRTLSIMQKLLDSELRKNLLFKYEEGKERKPVLENVVG